MLVDKRLKQKLTEIFHLFDKNNNGRISADEIDLDNIEISLLIVFRPLLIEMENFCEELDLEEFIESSKALIE
jgi:hypothetical protein